MPATWIYVLAVPAVSAVAAGTYRGYVRARRARSPQAADRNPGPEFGYAYIAWQVEHAPRWFHHFMAWIGTWVAYWTLPGQRACSREFLALALGRPATRREVWTHFRAYTEYIFVRMATAGGREPRIRFAHGHGDELRAFLAGDGSKEGEGAPAALYGTMHLGHSDLIGFFLGHLGGRLHMVRKQVGNSEDTERLSRRYARDVSIIWINDWSRLVLAMNDALRAGRSLALQCDRPEYSSKLEAFEFFGARRLFPFTIYHLAIMHGLPVVMSFAVPDEADPGMTVVHVLPMFRPVPERIRTENFAAAHAHFQSFLAAVETQLRRTPFLWFNYTPMNPPADAAMASGMSAVGRRLRTAAVEAGGRRADAKAADAAGVRSA